MRYVTEGRGPHAGQPIATAGKPLGDATGALILAHGRGGDADEVGIARQILARVTGAAPSQASLSQTVREQRP